MKITEYDVEGLLLIEPQSFEDERGFFMERFNRETFSKKGLPNQFVQDNFSRSRPGVLRGLHYQWAPPQGKLVTCLSGAIFDVAVDIRHGSRTFGQHVGVELRADRPCWFWIPAGFAHGFCVIGDQPADVMYKVDNPWGKGGESGLVYNDPDLNIKWPVSDPILAPKDSIMPSFREYRGEPRFEL